jgi:hypothetical protein
VIPAGTLVDVMEIEGATAIVFGRCRTTLQPV